MTQYDDVFFEYVNSGAIRSAKIVLPLLLNQLPVKSVLDVGCGQGAWLSVWRDLGIPVVVGIDGSYVNKTRLLCPKDVFVEHDLSRPFDLGRRFELVQSLEVAEHLSGSSASGFVESLVRHGDMVLFSAAPPGQGGDHHVNEQDYEYWRAHFARYDYVPFDFIRPALKSYVEIEPWYRYNSILYVKRSKLECLPPAIGEFMINDEQVIGDVSPLSYRLRKFLVSKLSVSTVTWLAKLKERRVANGLRSRSMP